MGRGVAREGVGMDTKGAVVAPAAAPPPATAPAATAAAPLAPAEGTEPPEWTAQKVSSPPTMATASLFQSSTLLGGSTTILRPPPHGLYRTATPLLPQTACRYGRGCTHMKDVAHCARFWHPAVVVSYGERIRIRSRIR